MEVIRLIRLHRGREDQYRAQYLLPKQFESDNGIKAGELEVAEMRCATLVRYYEGVRRARRSSARSAPRSAARP